MNDWSYEETDNLLQAGSPRSRAVGIAGRICAFASGPRRLRRYIWAAAVCGKADTGSAVKEARLVSLDQKGQCAVRTAFSWTPRRAFTWIFREPRGLLTNESAVRNVGDAEPART